MAKPATTKTAMPKLPNGILKSDTQTSGDYRYYRDRLYEHDFEMWFTQRFGWVIPTLLIRKARSASAAADRTYAISVDGASCRVGLGPHVTARVSVYVRKSRLKALQKFIDLKARGAVHANEKRDDLSTRRMRHSFY